jgi:tetratricopeptide (TPR) repeat protein
MAQTTTNTNNTKSEYSIKDITDYYKTKNFDKVKDKLESWITKEPATFPIEGFLLLGNIYDHFKMYESALKVYEKGIGVAKNKFPYIVNMAQVYRHMLNHQKALDLLTTVRPKASIYPEIELFLGMSYFEMRDRMKTIESWEKFVALKPEGPKPDKIRTALAWLKQKDFKWPEELKKRSESEAEELKKFLDDLKNTINKDKLQEIQQNPDVKEEKLKINDKGKEEGDKFDEIER